jgi:hypothetical protein
MRDGRLCYSEGVLALVEDVVGVTLGVSCMAAMVLQSLRWMGGWRGHATTISGVTAVGNLFRTLQCRSRF